MYYYEKLNALLYLIRSDQKSENILSTIPSVGLFETHIGKSPIINEIDFLNKSIIDKDSKRKIFEESARSNNIDQNEHPLAGLGTFELLKDVKKERYQKYFDLPENQLVLLK